MNAASSIDTADRVLLRENVTQFLAREARLLDEGQEEEWYGTLDDEYELFIPIRQATEPRSNEIDRSGYRTKETKAHVRIRLDRLATGMAYSEVPPSRTMRMVGSIDIEETDRPDVVAVRSAVLLYRQRGIDPHFDLLPYRRYDTLRSTAEGLRLLSREIILTEVSLATPNLGLFL
ncbi:phenylpropionate dioxygenase [Nocardia vinacea]|uniref:Phenylpropionate dioxygenase n=1 Tax=Nocardia vinacea TaxID=96468 RepID=A0ABZ1YP91_9NOCA|nr:aromatic-ring-hydroxylating dioxygenase subunit beta [Nocardia vinacea]